jgi:hypothetical protein
VQALRRHPRSSGGKKGEPGRPEGVSKVDPAYGPYPPGALGTSAKWPIFCPLLRPGDEPRRSGAKEKGRRDTAPRE